LSRDTELTVEILPQPDDTTCGPTCLHAVYRYYGDDQELDEVIRAVTPLATGGTLGVFLGLNALQRGYGATLYTYNLELFDPTWFRNGDDLSERLKAQAAVKGAPRVSVATEAYIDFLEAGGRIRFEELHPNLIRHHLQEGHPILTGLSATYLYECAREVDHAGTLSYDSVAGTPTGHFVVVHGYDESTDSVLVADPLRENTRFPSHNYRVGIVRLLGAILVGLLTYDGNLLVLDPDGVRA